MESYTELKLCDTPCDNLSQTSGKSVLHFSDGIMDLEELESDEVDGGRVDVDPQTLSWAPWMWYYTVFAGSKALQACDYLGESLATFFGITTPKYQYEINEYMRLKREEENNQANKSIVGNWTGGSGDSEPSPGNINAEPQSIKPEEYELQTVSVGETETKY